MLNSGQNWLFVLCDLEIWRMTLKINKISFLFYVNLWASFQRIQIGVTVRKRSIRVKIGDFLAAWPRNLTDDLDKQYSSIPHQALCAISKPSVNSNWSCSPETPFVLKSTICFNRVTLRFDRWPWKTIGHLSQYTSSFVHRLIAIGEFKLELQSENVQFGPKSAIFCPVWPWNSADDL